MAPGAAQAPAYGISVNTNGLHKPSSGPRPSGAGSRCALGTSGKSVENIMATRRTLAFGVVRDRWAGESCVAADDPGGPSKLPPEGYSRIGPIRAVGARPNGTIEMFAE